MTGPEKPKDSDKKTEAGVHFGTDGSNLEQRLGIDEIQDAGKREIVSGYFKHTLTDKEREGLVHENAKIKLEKLKQQIHALNERNATAEEFVHQIIETMQEDLRERDMNEGYTDQNGQHMSYLEAYFKDVGTDVHDDSAAESSLEAKYKAHGTNERSMDWDNRQIFNACLEKLKTAIRAVPANAKRELRHQYVLQYIRSFSAAIDESDHPFSNVTFSDFSKIEDTFAKKYPVVQNFTVWLQSKGISPEEAYVQYSKLDAKSIADMKKKIEKDKQALGSYSKEQQDYYTAQMNGIESLALVNHAEAQAQLTALETDMAALTAFVDFKKELEDLRAKYNEAKAKYSDIDGLMDSKITDLQKQYDKKAADLNGETNLQKRAALTNLMDLRKNYENVSADLTKFLESKQPKSADGQNSEAGNGENPQEAEAKPGFQDQLVLGDEKLQEIVKKLANVPLIGGFIVSFLKLAPSTLKTLNINANPSLDLSNLGTFLQGQNMSKTPEELKKIDAKAKDLLKKNYEIQSVGEMEVLAHTKMKDFVKPDFLKGNPGKFDKKRYDTFVVGLNKNGADKVTNDQTVFEFFLTKVESWQK